MTAGRALVAGTLAVGVLDLADAMLFFGITRGVRPMTICQSIAAGVLGRDAFAGGLPTAALGVVLHFFIALVVVLVFLLASRRIGFLRTRTWTAGILYGLVVYVVMSQIVVPLSAAGGTVGQPPFPVLVNGVLIHMFGVGLPAALAARAAS